MQALEKAISSNYWITILLVALFFFIFLLKGLNFFRLKGIVGAFFNNGFTEEESEDRRTFFKSFDIIMLFFSISVFSLILYSFLIDHLEKKENEFLIFGKIFLVTSFYFIVKWYLEYLISILFLIKSEVRFFLVSKSTYLYTISFVLFIAVILFMYTRLGVVFLGFLAIGLFLVRFVFHIANNKKLISSKFFYFILYLCAFEIAPLLILFKLMV
ncbi:MAG: DUF4271 domain-containing protein [Polaribacter sp.]